MARKQKIIRRHDGIGMEKGEHGFWYAELCGRKYHAVPSNIGYALYEGEKYVCSYKTLRNVATAIIDRH